MIKRLSIVLSAVICAASCADELYEGVSSVPSEDSVMTKVINTPSDAEEGQLLLCLTETAADAVAAGDRSLYGNISGVLQVKSFAPVFNSSPDDEVARRHNLHRWYYVEFDGEDLRGAASKLAAFSDVAMVQFNKKLKPASDCSFNAYTPVLGQMSSDDLPFNDPMLGDQWHCINTGSALVSNSSVAGGDIAVKDAWRLTGGDPRVIVAIIDSPVKYDHPDLAANMWRNEGEIPANGIDDDRNGYTDDVYGWNCERNNGEINWSSHKASGHGTHVAGIVAAVNANGTGVCGVAGGTGKGDGVRMMSCQIFEGGISSNLKSSAIAFEYAAKNGASVAQCSFGLIGAEYESDAEYEMSYGAEHDAIEYFMDKDNNNSEILDGNIVIAAAGNEQVPYSSYPAGLQNVVSVTGLGPDYLPAVNYTNYGPGCNIAAPGGDFYIGNITSFKENRSRVLSTFIDTIVDDNLQTAGHEYVYMQGTSMACPCVSGVAALGLSYAYKLGKTFTREEFISLLLTSVNNLDSRLTDNKLKVSGYTNGLEQTVDLGLYRGKMGTGAVDAWKFLMAIEGTPSLTVKVLDESAKAERYDLTSYFGGSASSLTYLSVDCDQDTRTSLGLSEDPEIKYGKLSIKPTKVGSGKITITAIAGYDEDGLVDGETQTGGMEITRTVSIMSRGVASDNGGWL
ncbi:MAG: S8 family serine peptidase [Bacteroidales bacterium]|nr:S8 family serine peptidase [Bacteroidales bacterium]